MTSFLDLLIKELEKVEIYPQGIVDLAPVIVIVDKIDKKLLEKITKESTVINLIISQLINIVKDNKITIEDTPYIIEILKVLYTSLGQLENIQIKSQDLVNIATDIIIIVLSICITNKEKLVTIVKIVETTGVFINFTMPITKTLSCKCISC